MRLQLQRLCGRTVCQVREAAESVRAGRQRNLPHAQAALSGAGRRFRRRCCGGARAVTAAPEAPAKSPLATAPGRSRDNPVYATFLSRRRLNKPGSEKETWHIDIDLSGTDLDYVVGDSFGIFPANDHDLVAAVLAALDMPADFPKSATALSAKC